MDELNKLRASSKMKAEWNFICTVRAAAWLDAPHRAKLNCGSEADFRCHRARASGTSRLTVRRYNRVPHASAILAFVFTCSGRARRQANGIAAARCQTNPVTTIFQVGKDARAVSNSALESAGQTARLTVRITKGTEG